MYRLTANYAHPADHDAFVAHYRDVHAKLAAKLPDLRAFGWGVCETPDGSKPAHALIAVLDWDSKEVGAGLARLAGGGGGGRRPGELRPGRRGHGVPRGHRAEV